MRRISQTEPMRLAEKSERDSKRRAAETRQKKMNKTRAGEKAVGALVAGGATFAASGFAGSYKAGPVPLITLVGVVGVALNSGVPDGNRGYLGESAIKSAEYMFPAGLALAARDAIGGELPFGS